MKIDFYCVSICQNDGEPTQLAGCGIVVVFTDDHNRTKFRTFKYALGNSTQRLADLQVIRLALASVRSPFRSANACLHINSTYAARMLEKSGKAFVESFFEYEYEIKEVRQWFGYYGKMYFVVGDMSNENMLQAKYLADIALATQEHADSGTLEL